MSDSPVDDETKGEQDIRRDAVITLSGRDSQSVKEALQHPSDAGSALKRAAKRYSKLVREK